MGKYPYILNKYKQKNLETLAWNSSVIPSQNNNNT